MHTFFSSWDTLRHVVLVAILGYASLLLMMRISGKRSLAKMNVFDFVVVVALGSILANAITMPTTSLADAAAGFAVLLGIKFLIALVTQNSSRLETIVNGRPTLLLHRGRVLQDQVDGERVTMEELRAAARAAGVGRFEDIDAIVLETHGQFTVLREVPRSGKSTLKDVKGAPEDRGT